MLYVFGDCTLDTQLYTLQRAGQVLRLRPKVFQVLRYLLEHHDRVISNDELCAQVWPGYCISAATLGSTLRAVRQALGDTGRTQRLIQTLPGHGYRLVAAVAVCPEAGPHTLAAVPPPESAAGAPTHGVLDAERKPVTVLCCTLVRPPALGEPSELETLYRLIRTLADLAQPIVRRYEGVLQPVTGERLTTLFGVPMAQEDHAVRAVLAALELHQQVTGRHRTASALPEVPLAVRLSLHTGWVVVDGVGETAAPSAAVVGDTVVVAAALQEHAAPGTILCSAATARLVQRVVRLAPVPPLTGAATLPRAYQILRLRPHRAPLAPRRDRRLSPFVGRERELATLHALLAQAVAGRGQAVGIVGEPGIGKSRLVAEFCHSLPPRTYTSLAGQCLSYGQGTPYLPVLDLLWAHCRITPTDRPAEITAKVQRAVQAVGMAPDVAPYLLHLLGLPLEPDELAALSPQLLKARTLDILVQLCLTGSRQRPLILTVEDVHWIDAPSDEGLTLLVERLAGAPILLVTTYRPGYRPACLDKSYATQWALAPLTPQDSRRVLQAVWHAVPTAEGLTQEIVAKAEGNPFFLEELAWMVREQGEHAQHRSVPDTIQAALAARLDRLPPEEKRLMQIAAVIGTEVPVALLHAMADVPEEALHRGLAHLQTVEFLYATHLVPEHVYTFKHALTQEVAYGSLLHERRRALHAGIVAASERLYADHLTEQAERLAQHAFRGEVWDKAVAYCRQAGAKALARWALREGVACVEQALAALTHLPESRTTQEQAIDLRFELRDAFWQLGDIGQMLDSLRQAATLAEILDDQVRLGRVSVYMCRHLREMGDHDGAVESGQHALAVAATRGDFALQVHATYHLGIAYHFLGDQRRAMKLLRRNVESLAGDLIYERFGMVGHPAVQSRAWLVRCLAELGAFPEASAHAEEAVRLAEAVDHPLDLAQAYLGVGCLALRQGDFPRAISVLERGLDLCRVSDILSRFPETAAALGCAYACAGRVAEALSLLEQAEQRSAAMGSMGGHALRVGYWSEAYLLAGRMQEAAQLAGRALALARTHKERGHEAWVLRLLGEIAAHQAPPEVESAAAHYRQALALADELGMRPLQAHCHFGLGTLYAKTGQREQARTALSTAMEMYRTMAMTFWLPQTEAALAQVERQ